MAWRFTTILPAMTLTRPTGLSLVWRATAPAPRPGARTHDGGRAPLTRARSIRLWATAFWRCSAPVRCGGAWPHTLCRTGDRDWDAGAGAGMVSRRARPRLDGRRGGRCREVPPDVRVHPLPPHPALESLGSRLGVLRQSYPVFSGRRPAQALYARPRDYPSRCTVRAAHRGILL
jgi:hypothetical protein